MKLHLRSRETGVGVDGDNHERKWVSSAESRVPKSKSASARAGNEAKPEVIKAVETTNTRSERNDEGGVREMRGNERPRGGSRIESGKKEESTKSTQRRSR